MKVAVLSVTPLIAALTWTVALLVDPVPFAPEPSLLIAIGLLGMTTVGMVGVTVTGGRWAYRTSLASVGAMLVLAVARPIDLLWVIALVTSVLAGASLSIPALTGSVRKLPSAAGPPPRAVLIPLLLIGFPFLLGLATWDDPSIGTLVLGLGAPLAAFWYSRVLPGGLYVVRILWPTLAVGLAFTQSIAPAMVSIVIGAAIAALAWHSSVKVAFHPPRQVGTVHPIPPELAPGEVLDAANLDDRGRRIR